MENKSGVAVALDVKRMESELSLLVAQNAALMDCLEDVRLYYRDKEILNTKEGELYSRISLTMHRTNIAPFVKVRKMMDILTWIVENAPDCIQSSTLDGIKLAAKLALYEWRKG